MVTATPESIVAPPQLVPIVKAAYELPRVDSKGKLIRYARLNRGRTDLYDKIFNDHCPKVPLESIPKERREILHSEYRDLEGQWYKSRSWDSINTHIRVEPDNEDSELTPIMVPDPDVIFVGALSAGLVWLKLFADRMIYKNFMHEVNHQTDGRCEATFYRDGQESVRLGEIVLDNEPGDIINSPEVLPSAVSAKIARDRAASGDMWRDAYTSDEWDPIVRVDNRFGLHYLKRGDKIVLHAKGWPRPGSPEIERTYILKPPSEGESFVPIAQAPDTVDLAHLARR